LFDGAYDSQNEKEAGDGIRKAISDGLVKREEVFVTTQALKQLSSKRTCSSDGEEAK
jgi:D-xylose reductase